MMGPSLKKGVGGPSPYGGTIVRKEIIGLDPARSADGQDHPDKFIPRLRVYVKGDDGKTKYYDAPVTKNRSTDPNDTVVAVNMSDAMDFMGNMSVLTTALEHPDIKAKLDEGVKAAGPELQNYLDELRTVSRPTKKLETTEKIALPADSGETILIKRDSQGKEIGRETLKHGAKPFRPSSGGGGARGGKTPKGPSNAEQTQLIRDGENAAATALGMTYDAGLKNFKNIDGKPMTPEKLQALAEAKGRVAEVVRAAATRGERPSGDDVKKALGIGKKTVKFSELK